LNIIGPSMGAKIWFWI